MPKEENEIALNEIVFCIVDLETTGATAEASAITEIGAIKVRGGEILGEFSTFVNPLSPLPYYITELTGITDEMLAPAPIIDEIFNDFLNFIEEGVERNEKIVLVAHNAPFDLSFLKAAAKQLDLLWPKYSVLDTVQLARKTVSKDEVMNYKLATLAQYFETSTPPTHRALDDVKTTVEILNRLIERLGGFDVYSFKELEKFMGKRL